MIRALIALILGGIAATSIVSMAAASGDKAVFELDCGADGTFQVIANNGNGQWRPAKIISGGRGTVIPLAFLNRHAHLVDADGNVSDVFPPDVVKPAGPGNKHVIRCHFDLTFEDGAGGGGTLSADILGFIAGG